MGADGGSIPDRRDLVKNKPKAQQTDGENVRRAQWSLCSLSKRPLQSPIVLDALGRMYNKDAMLEYLLDRSSYGDGESICGHVRGFKDLLTINLTPNPNATSASESTDDTTDLAPPKAPFSCPLTQREANGTSAFLALRPCGDVFSEAGLKATLTTTTPSSSSPSEEKPKATCPTCSTVFQPTFLRSALSDSEQASSLIDAEVVYINPPLGVQEDMRIAICAARAEEKVAKKAAKKRKSVGGDEEGGGKRSKGEKKAAGAPVVQGGNARVGLIAKAVADELKAAEEKRKAGGMSEAVKSLYAGRKGKEEENFITRGTFTRYA